MTTWNLLFIAALEIQFFSGHANYADKISISMGFKSTKEQFSNSWKLGSFCSLWLLFT